MTSQTGKQTLTIHIAQYLIKQRQSNKTMKFDQLIDYNVRIFFFKTHAGNEVGRLVLSELKASVQQLSFYIFW